MRIFLFLVLMALMPAAWAQSLGLVVRDINNQAVVTAVSEHSPAAKAGLRDGDVLRQVDQTAVTSTASLIASLGERAGSTVKLQIDRRGKAKRLSLKVPDGFGATSVASPKGPARKLDLLDTWTVAMHCGGNDYVLSATLRLEGKSLTGTVSGHATLPALETQRPPSKGHVVDARYQGTLDRVSGRFSLRPVGRNSKGLTFDGVYLAPTQQLVAEVGGRQWQQCSSAIFVPGVKQDAARALLSKPMSTRPYRSIARSRCRDVTRRWLQDFSRMMDALPAAHRANPRIVRASLVSLYAEPRFSEYFGKPLRDLSEKQAHRVHGELTAANACDTALPAEQARWLREWVMPLRNPSSFGRGHVLVNLAARSRYQQWAREISQHTFEPAVGYTLVDASREVHELDILLKSLDVLLAPTGVNADILNGVTSNIAYVALDAALDHPLANAAATMAGLNQIAGVLPAHADLTDRLDAQQRAALEGRRDAAVASKLDAVALAFARAQQGEPGLVAVSDWRASVPYLAQTLNQTQLARVSAVMAQRGDQLGEQIVATLREAYRKAVTEVSSPSEQLAASVEFEAGMAQRSARVAALPEMQVFTQVRLRRHSGLLSQHQQILIARIESSQNAGSADALVKRHVLAADTTLPARAIRLAATQRVAHLSPFLSLPAGEYLDGIFNNDTSKVRALDARFIAPFRNGQFGEGMNMMAPLMDGIASLAGVNTDFGEYIRQSLDASSLLLPMLAIYLLDYQEVYKKCLRPGAVRFRKTVTSATVYSDSNGFETSRIQHPDKISHFWVNKEFGAAFQEVGLNNPDSPLAGMFERMIHTKGEITVSQVVRGTREMMGDYPCDDPKIKRMEDQMLAFFAQYQVRINAARRSLIR